MPHGKTVSGENFVTLANKQWVDEDITTTTHPDDTLSPGESVVPVKIVANDEDVKVYFSLIGTTHHTADIDGDGTDESIVRYRIEQKRSRGDRWSPLQNAVQTAPFGTFNGPIEPMPGKLIGPFDALRVRFSNRSDGYANPVDVQIEQVGAYLTAALSRDGDHLAAGMGAAGGGGGR